MLCRSPGDIVAAYCARPSATTRTQHFSLTSKSTVSVAERTAAGAGGGGGGTATRAGASLAGAAGVDAGGACVCEIGAGSAAGGRLRIQAEIPHAVSAT